MLVVEVYSKIYNVISVEYVGKTAGLGAEKVTELAMETIKENGMRGTVSEDKKTIVAALLETSANKRIARKCGELEERTHKLQERLAPKASETA